MNLNMEAMLVRKPSNAATDGSEPINARHLSLFEAVRIWSNQEGADFDVVADGKPLTDDQIKEILRSNEFKAALLAFDERR